MYVHSTRLTIDIKRCIGEIRRPEQQKDAYKREVKKQKQSNESIEVVVEAIHMKSFRLQRRTRAKRHFSFELIHQKKKKNTPYVKKEECGGGGGWWKKALTLFPSANSITLTHLHLKLNAPPFGCCYSCFVTSPHIRENTDVLVSPYPVLLTP
ncbi:hypothetical protein, unlikely [Trypanosoma brucei gambiense DAL972]|uniref:Uncharacterized protein n=1 Tax=Trypanosoma brucei gambiense (strain MHOM/CI/86/DAL972) TaxID=679716 RepID=D0A1Q8_TRYB9|nr:hypothetical protein, unlikely [Trypanosoma brucei gambiense DAL972]CBH15201.1 hypothetical protein, unlikely [Trypanosoma brucei gambiense DAL972]|eukprot:XP_011777466.1 hypothetical protein, unlikely [Trypanosoma brucei gambiense DAL972]